MGAHQLEYRLWIGDAVPFFSVIIPVYGVREFVGECAASVVRQTFGDIEVILVDDGSTDGSGAVCDEFALRDSRILVVHQENEGLSSARNTGIRESTGEYLLFIDGDDYYDDVQFFADLRDHILKNEYPDITVFGRKSYFSDRQLYEDDDARLDEGLNGLDVRSVLGRLIETDSLSISACTRAVRREFLIEHELFFEVGLRSEDVEWSLRAFDRLSRISVIDRKPYAYRRGRAESITSSIGVANVRDGIATLEKYANGYEYSSVEMREVLLAYVAYQFCIFCGLLVHLEQAERAECLRRLRPLKWLLAYDASPKVRLVKRVSRVLGFQLTVRILESYIGLRRS